MMTLLILIALQSSEIAKLLLAVLDETPEYKVDFTVFVSVLILLVRSGKSKLNVLNIESAPSKNKPHL